MDTEQHLEEDSSAIRGDWPSRRKALTAADTTEIIDACTSLALGEFRMREKFGLTAGELSDLLLDYDVERCPSCRLLTDSHALTGDNGDVDGYCDNCRKYKQ